MTTNGSTEESKTVAKDPVCGMTVDKKGTVHADIDGKTYYFCGYSCRDKFQLKPSRETEDAILKDAAQHGQQEHGTKTFVQDIRAGLRSKIRDVRSPQIRGSDS